jgi:hypothetical protein
LPLSRFRSAETPVNSTATLTTLGPATDLLPSQRLVGVAQWHCTVAQPVKGCLLFDWSHTHTDGPLLCMHRRQAAP